MALFRKKDGDDSSRKDVKGEPFVAQPEKARKWFDHAKTTAMSTNFEYALECYANGLKLDPEVMTAHHAMYEVALKYAGNIGKPASGKEIRAIDDGTPVGKFAAAEFAWMKDINNGALAVKALEAAVKAGQHEWGNWAAGRALALMRRSNKKLSKGQLLTAKDLFAEVGAWDEAIAAGQLALQLDPRDAGLDSELKDLAAQRAMDQGGYAEAQGEEGGFRKFVRDADKQQELVESEAIAGATSVEERNLLRAKQAYEASPGTPDVINAYAQLVKKQGTPEALEEAHRIYSKGFEDTGEYRFRMNAGDIRIEQRRIEVKNVAERVQSNGETDDLRQQLKSAQEALLDLESSEYRERVSKYPTNRPLKYQLGTVEFKLRKFTEAMECFQKAKDEPKLRVRAGHMLGRCFAAEDWHNDAIMEYREALSEIDATEEERELEIRYDLMVSLIEHAREESSADLAREARDICSSIARKDISFRDIRQRRTEVDELVKSLGGPGG